MHDILSVIAGTIASTPLILLGWLIRDWQLLKSERKKNVCHD